MGVSAPHKPHKPHKPIRHAVVVFAILGLLIVAACGQNTRFSTPGSSGKDSHALAPISLSVAAPADKATNVSTSTEVEIRTNGKVTDVKLTSPDGATISGGFPYGNRTWVPESQLAYDTKYELAVTGNQGPMQRTVGSSFTTMSSPSNLVAADIYLNDGETVGVGLPVVVEFTDDIAADRRAAVERRLFVTSTPATEGAWHWFSGSQVHFRPQEYWKPGTQISVRLAIGGMDLGQGRYGKQDRSVGVTVGSSVISTVTNGTKHMKVVQDGVLLREFPVSLGREIYPSSSGTLVVMEKAQEMVFDSSTFGIPVNSAEGYRQTVYWDVRLTWGGEFIHSAPWSVGDQGVRNVSHGCVNVAPENAQWFFELAKKGDVVIVEGTEQKVAKGDGWTDWDMSWPEYLEGSALKH